MSQKVRRFPMNMVKSQVLWDLISQIEKGLFKRPLSQILKIACRLDMWAMWQTEVSVCHSS